MYARMLHVVLDETQNQSRLCVCEWRLFELNAREIKRAHRTLAFRVMSGCVTFT